MSRVGNLRTMGRYNVVRVTNRDWSLKCYQVKPRGFDTALFEVVKPKGTSTQDFDNFMRAVARLCDAQVK